MLISNIRTFKIGTGPDQVDMKNPGVVTDDSLGGYSLCDFSFDTGLLTPNLLRFTMRRNKISLTDETLKFSLSSKLVGKNIECMVETLFEGAQRSWLSFTGTIVKASMKGVSITCEAVSEDSSYEDAPKSRCFVDMKLEDVVKAVVPGALVKIHNCFADLKFSYIVQYNESDYDFLARLAKRFGAFFYYDVSNGIVFGKPTKQIIELESFDFSAPQFNLQMGNPNRRIIAHDYEKNVDINCPLDDFKRDGSGHLFKSAAEGSVGKEQGTWNFYVDYPNILPQKEKRDDALMIAYNKAMLSSDSTSMVTCNILIYRFDIRVGSFIKLKHKVKTGVPPAQVTKDVNNGVMLVISSHLTWDCNGSPQNEITAIVLPEDSTVEDDIFAPYMDINAYPKSCAQRAEVFDNADPLKMGRVQVFFAWQKDLSDGDKKKLPWIRIAQPYGGSKDGKGFYLIPEKKEEVMVGFEHENMEKPFVIGTLFHSSDDDQKKQLPADSWCEVPAKDGNPAKNEENEVKAFRTKKGHTIEFHDTKQGDGFIRIYGNESKKPNYDIILSTDPIKVGDNKDQDYEVESASVDKDEGKDKFKAEKLRIMVCSNGGDIVLDAGAGDIVMNAQNIRLHAKGDRTAYVEGKDVVKVDDVRFVKTNESRFYVDADQIVHVEDEDQYSSKKLKIDVDNAIEVAAQSLTSKTDQKTEIKAASIAAEANQDVAVTAKTELKLDGGSYAKMSANNLDVESNINAMLSSANTTVEGKATLNLKTAKGGRTGLWSDGAV